MSEKKYVEGYIGKTKNGLKYVVLGYKNDIITIKFLETGYITQTNTSKMNGYIKDRLKPSVCGVGYLGDCDVKSYSKEYTVWRGIIERCYNTKRKDYKSYGLLGVTVCDRWKCFANFVKDLPCVDGYDKYKFLNNELDLDKDIKQKDIPISKKIYSQETCMFVDKHINRAITTRKPTENVNIMSIKGDYILKTFCPVEELAEQLGIKTQYITRILRGDAKTHNGWTFQYCKDYTIQN